MDNMKIVFIGPVGAGKTSAIQVISEIAPVNTEAKISEPLNNIKETTTVAIDYGRVSTATGIKVHLYGAPGQVRFEFMWDMLTQDIAKDCHAVVVMINNSAPEPLKDLLYYVQAFAELIENKKLLVVVTRADESQSPAISDFEACLSDAGMAGSVVTADARNATQVKAFVSNLVGPLA